MQLIVTQPVFLWIFGLIGVLVTLFLIVLVVMAFQLLRLVRFVNEKSEVVGSAVDEVRGAVHTVSQSLESTSGHIAQFVNVTMSAAGIAKLVGAARDLWGKRHHDDLFDEEEDAPRRRPRSSK